MAGFVHTTHFVIVFNYTLDLDIVSLSLFVPFYIWIICTVEVRLIIFLSFHFITVTFLLWYLIISPLFYFISLDFKVNIFCLIKLFLERSSLFWSTYELNTVSNKSIPRNHWLKNNMHCFLTQSPFFFYFFPT